MPRHRCALARRRASEGSEKLRISPSRSTQQPLDRRLQQSEEKSVDGAECNGEICANHEDDYGKSTNVSLHTYRVANFYFCVLAEKSRSVIYR